MTAPYPHPGYLIAPRYLAGPDEQATHALMHALPAMGWHVEHLRQAYAFHLREADGLLEAVYVPAHLPAVRGTGPGVGWEFTARTAPGTPAAWKVCFAPATPPELITTLATALTDPEPGHEPGQAPHYLRPPVAPLAATGPLEAAGWMRDRGTDESAWYAPGQQAVVVTPTLPRPSGPGTTNWLLSARRAADAPSLWHASAHPGTPTHLIRALCAALTDPAPVVRPTRPGPDIGAATTPRT
ncbi:DUF317 domain-containing protein [Streptomyces sp. NPDC102360]|uniref:DUF317 domain-containing protein n=1 Tax=Streptomyces sp. NPDC102360 TaxID=3366160 RepID=UPI00380760A7